MKPEMKGGFANLDGMLNKLPKLPGMPGKGKKGGSKKLVGGGEKVDEAEAALAEAQKKLKDDPDNDAFKAAVEMAEAALTEAQKAEAKAAGSEGEAGTETAADGSDAGPKTSIIEVTPLENGTYSAKIVENSVQSEGGKRRKRKTAAKKSKKSKKGTRKARKGRK